MPALRIEFLPLQDALSHTSEQNEQVLNAEREAIITQGIESLRFKMAGSMQCILWVSGTEEDIVTLRAYLDGRHFIYTCYEGTSATQQLPQSGDGNEDTGPSNP